MSAKVTKNNSLSYDSSYLIPFFLEMVLSLLGCVKEGHKLLGNKISSYF